MNNKKHKKWTYWSQSGQKTEEINYDSNGVQDGAHIKWFDEKNDQHKKFHVNYKNGEKDGSWHYWYTNGIDSVQSHYKNGEKNGHWVWWRKNGLKDKEVTIKMKKNMAFGQFGTIPQEPPTMNYIEKHL